MGFNKQVLELDEQVTEALQERINKAYRTNMIDVLLSTLALTIRDWTNEANTLITLISHDREEQIKTIDISRTVGCFSSQFPVLLRAYDDLGDTIKHTKDMMRRVPNQGRFYEMMTFVSSEDLHHVEPEISFTYLGKLDMDTSGDLCKITSDEYISRSSKHPASTHSLGIETALIENKLMISIFYEEDDFYAGTIEKLLATYQDYWTRLIHHCTAKQEAEITVTDITLEDVSIDQLSAYKHELNNIKNIYPLAPMQEGMLYHALTDELDTYIKLSCFQVEGEIDLAVLDQAFNIVIERHDIIRTIFDYSSFKQNMQVVYRNRKAAVEYIDITDQGDNNEAYLEQLIRQYRTRRFDLSKDMLLRIVLVRMKENVYSMIFHLHHILMDGWCNSLILIELFKIYNELKHGIKASLNEVVPYFTYIDWLKNKDINEATAYWKEYLYEYKEVTKIPFEKESKTNEIINNETVLVINEEKTACITRIAQESKVTVNTVIQSIWALLLNKYNNTDDIVYGYVVSGRNAEIEGVEVIPGLFINTIPLRVKFAENLQYQDLMKHISSITLQNSKYDYVSLAEIQNQSEVKSDLISSLLVFENYPIDEKQLNEEILKNKDIKILNSVFVLPHQLIEGTNYNLTLVVNQDDTTSINFIYNKNAYSEEGISKIIAGFDAVVTQIIENRHISIKDIEIVDDEDKHRILHEFNHTQSQYPKDKSIVQLFEEQVEKVPNHTALIYQDEHVTYDELNERANRLAHHLRQKGVGKNVLVGIIGERSVQMVIGILGILKAGGAYLPIDSKYPTERMITLLADSNTELLLTQSTYMEALRQNIGSHIEVMLMEQVPEELSSERCSNPLWMNSSSDLAYVMYTSGSTGKPKGVMVEHKSVVRLVRNTNYVEFAEGDRILQTGSVVFDASTFELWGALLNGISLVLVDEHVLLHAERLGQEIRKNLITTMWLTSPLFNQLVQQDVTIFTGLKTLVVGGDALSGEHINQVRKAHQSLNLINGYGPTENTTFSTCFAIEKEFSSSIPIGKAISNSNAYILDRHNHLQPIGVAGELCVAGDGLARGYLNNAELTAEKFVPNPFEPGTRMYKTGDLARWLPDGNIEYLGRIDEQVKIRGFRIEPNEIAQHLLLHEHIQDAIVVACIGEDGQAYLCAYVVSDVELSASALREHISQSLPSYMIPSYFVQMERLPLTPNGKVDRKALPEPDGEVHTGVEYIAPRNDMEKSIAQVWEKILGVRNVGINDEFFALGGDSIKAIQAISQMSNKGYSFEIKDLMANPRIKDLIVHIKHTKKTIDQSEVSGEIELTPIQKWFLEEEHIIKDHFNQELMLFSKDGFREDRIERAFDQIVQHHDILRATYVNQKFINREVTNKLYDLCIYDLTGTEIANEYITDLCTELQASMKLAKGPLVKLGLFKTDKGDYLLVSIHHMVVDAVSWRIIMDDFETLYDGQEQKLPLKTTSFQEWASKQKQYASGSALKNELKYWNSIGDSEIKELNKEKVPQNIHGAKIVKQSIVLDKAYTEKLLTKVNKAYATEINDILLSALTFTMGNFNQTERILINLESHGREQIVDDVDITRTVGWFTSQYPVVLHTKERVSDLIKNTKDTLRRIPRKGIGYGMLKYLSPFELNVLRKPDISFNYLGQFDENISGENFTLSDISPGDSVSKDSGRLYPLNISAMVLHKQFSLTLSYIREEFNDGTIEGLLQHYIESLKLIIDHCISQEHVELTASDLTDENIAWEELAPYLKQIDNMKRIYPLTPMQEGLLFHSLADKGEYYHVNMELRVIGDLNEELFNKSFRELVARHDVFRTNFDSSSFKENMQIVYKSREAELTYLDIRDLQVDREAYIEQLVIEDRKRGFDLSKDILIRLFVVRMHEQEYSLILSNHHIILDGWSFGIISSELFHIYSCHLQNSLVEAKKVRPYEEYIKWIGSQDKTEALNYWDVYLKGYGTTIEIPFKKALAAKGKPQEVILSLDKDMTKQIEVLAKHNNVTINTIFQSVWAIQLQRYNNVDDIVFGYIVSGRTTKINGIDEMVGLFINTIPLRVNTTHEKRYTEVLEKIKSDFNESEPYQYCSIAEVQKLTEVGTGLINGLMVFENYPIDEDMINKDIQEQINLNISSARIFEETNYSFNIKVIPGAELVVKFDYNDGVYDTEEVNKIKSHFSNILNQIITNPNIRIDDIEIVGTDEKNEVLLDLNDTYMDYPKEDTIQGLFEYQVTRNPEKTAVMFGGDTISYGEINKRANALANLLRDKGISAASIVPIMMDRSIDMVVGVLAILKAGAAYLPIDTNYPEDRINFILKDSKAAFMLSTLKLTQMRALEIKEVIDLEDAGLYALAHEQVDNINHSNDLAYVIYTSGTTGKPKGVMVEHKGIINLKYWFESDLGIGKDENILQFASIAFDAFSWELFMALLLGNTLCIPDKDVLLSADLLNEYISTHGITTLTLPPFVAANVEAANGLKRVITAGSELKYEQISHLLGKVEVINAYGPTEDTVCTTTCKLSPEHEAKITIGTPISNHRVLILDTHNKLVPTGITGELCIAGVGLARGYLNNEQLTQEKFIVNPYQEGERLYKTGDMARWLPDGNIEYVGRIDHQVKIRGYRIEIGEIEQNLLQLAQVSQVAVVDKEMDGIKYLCAYYVSDLEIAIHVLRDSLSKKLPVYMIPAHFIRMESLPFNLNGKVDRKQLPEIEGVIKTGIHYEEAENEVEALIINICKDVLGLQQLGVRDNLFEVGGDSIRIAKIHKELKKVKIQISIKDIFYYENVRDIYKHWANKQMDFNEVGHVATEPILTSLLQWKQSLTDQLKEFSKKIVNENKMIQAYPLSAMQEILLHTNKTYSGAILDFNHKVNVQLLRKSIECVINEQDLLRSTVIKSDHQTMIQQYGVVMGIEIPYLDLEHASEEQRGAIQAYIHELYGEHLERADIFGSLLYKVIMIKFAENDFKVYMPFNHLIFDAMSFEIIQASIRQAYSNNGELVRHNILQYEHYVTEQLKGPQGVTEKELIEKYKLNDFYASYSQYFEKYKEASLINTTISIPITDDIRESIEEMSWDISLKIFLKVLELNFELDTIPFAILHTGRKYQANNYYHTIGAFIDILPLSVRYDQHLAFEEINELISFAYEKNVNFAALMSREEPKNKYKKVRHSIKDIYSSEMIRIPIFNYLGMYDSQSEMVEELSRIKEIYGSQTNNVSTEIAIAVKEDELMIRLFCEEYQITRITQELHSLMNNFNKLLFI
ncbi:non-ribosomal peptide synthetase [Paenibacillus sp. UMB4589-SE434]|uniref:non-ribosomal peptide synthetase n=1 Tax=Paenibacillus sp. UMB4589-SE434 TaxID=3046314 RepID=UPI00254A4850|nr:non-ribosomal peptide synthetase [Paenibacillus sp. UMB4589-SE434]MDK8180277.1 amino acid adenylation domain-containing protein [Paenibacillus sp. UMB4589-SE434]